MAKEITPRQVAGELRRAHEGARKAAGRGILRSAHRGKAFLIAETDRKGAVDLGIFKNSFTVAPGGVSGTVAVLENDAPHAGIVELGARPHKVNRAGIDALTAWAKRKLAQGPVFVQVHGPTGRVTTRRPKMSDSAARGIAFAIAKKIEREGQQGKYIFRDALPTLSRFMSEEIERAIGEFAHRGGR